MKKLIFLCTVFLLSIIMYSPITNAEENFKTSIPLEKPDLSKPFVPLTDQELQKIRNSGKDYTVELTYEQAIERAAEISGKSIEKLKKENPNTCPSIAKTSNKTEKSINGYATTASTCSWLEKTTSHTVKSWTAKLIVMPQVCRDGSFGWVNTSKKPLLQEFKASTKNFSGTIKVDLRDNGYYYVVNGKFYEDTTVTHNGTTGANAIWTATYSVSSTSNVYGSLYTGLKWHKVVN